MNTVSKICANSSIRKLASGNNFNTSYNHLARNYSTRNSVLNTHPNAIKSIQRVDILGEIGNTLRRGGSYNSSDGGTGTVLKPAIILAIILFILIESTRAICRRFFGVPETEHDIKNDGDTSNILESVPAHTEIMAKE